MTVPEQAWRPPLSSPSRVAIAVGVAATVVSMLPVWLLGGLGVLIRVEVGFGPGLLGAAVSCFFAAAAAASGPVGRLVDRHGAAWALRVGSGISAVALTLAAATRLSWTVLAGALALGGVANAIVVPGANRALAEVVPSTRQGFAYGIKQSAPPIATLLASLALPLVGVTVGWRWAYVGAGVAAATLTIALPRLLPKVPDDAGIDGSRSVDPPTQTVAGDYPRPALVQLAVGAGAGAAAGGATAAFAVDSAVAHGLQPAVAGPFVAVATGGAIAVRLWAGWRADVRGRHHLPVVIALILAGALGHLLLAGSHALPMLVAGTLIAVVLGWGWAGLFMFAVLRRTPGAVGTLSGFLYIGVFSGGVLGPAAFGYVVEHAGYPMAWMLVAALMGTAAAGIATARHRLLRLPTHLLQPPPLPDLH